jgi:hypothetical protein
MPNTAGFKNDSRSRKGRRPLRDGELLLSHKGLTVLTGYSESTIRRMTKARSVRFPKDDILEVDRGAQGPGCLIAVWAFLDYFSKKPMRCKSPSVRCCDKINWTFTFVMRYTV